VYSFAPNTAHVNDGQNILSDSAVIGHVKVQSIKSRDATQTEGISPEPMAASDMFQSRIAGAHELSHTDRSNLLVEAFHACSPASNAWKYNTMVIRELLQLKWDPKAILEQHLYLVNFHVPDIYSHESMDLLVCLGKMISRFPHCRLDILQIHIKLAETASIKPSSNPYQDTRLLLLIRQLWRCAHVEGLGLDRPILDLLQSVAMQCKNKLCKETLSSIFVDVAKLEDCVLELVAKVAEHSGSLSAAVEVLSCVEKKRLSESIPNITLAYATNMSDKVGDEKAIFQARMHVWIQILHRLDAEFAMAGHSFVAKATRCLGSYTFAYRDHTLERVPALLVASLVNSSQTSTFDDVPMSKISAVVKAFTTKVEQCSDLRIEPALGMFMSDVRAKNLPHETLSREIIDYLVRYAGLGATAKFLQVMDRRQLTLVDGTAVYQLVAKKLAHIRGRKSRIEDAARLRVCATILDTLGRISSIPGHLNIVVEKLEAQRQFQVILGRARSDHLLPLAYRGVSATSSPEQRVKLIHQLAHQYTTDATLSQRQVWRAMWYLYRYMQQHSLPIGPLFTKAIVRICIIRPMSENCFVSAKRLLWVCRLVARVEGEEVAKQIEPLFWYWRGDLIQHAKGSYVGSGGDRQSKAHIGTMKKLGLI
jgi:hypothetical protein